MKVGVAVFFCGIAGAILAFGSIPAAAAGEGSSWGWLEGVGRFTNLFILLGVIYYFAREPLKKFFLDRRLGLQREIHEARREKEEAERKRAAVEERMRSLDRELAALREEAEKEAALERRRLVQQAERDSEKIVGAARREIDGLTRAAQKQLREYAAQLSVQLAEERVRREVSGEDEKRILERFFAELEESAKRGSDR